MNNDLDELMRQVTDRIVQVDQRVRSRRRWIVAASLLVLLVVVGVVVGLLIAWHAS